MVQAGKTPVRPAARRSRADVRRKRPCRSVLAHAQVAAEGLELDLALAAAALEAQALARAVLLTVHRAEVAADVAAEGLGVDRGGHFAVEVDVHVAAHGLGLDAAARAERAGDVHVAGNAVHLELGDRARVEMAVARDRFQADLAVEALGLDVAAHALEARALRRARAAHVAAHGLELIALGARVDPEIAADAVDVHRAAAVEAGDVDLRGHH